MYMYKLTVVHIPTCIARFPSSAPSLKHEYNQHMAGVDWLDQRMSYYSFARKSVRWWRKVFFWLVEVMVVNAYTLYMHNSAPAQRKISHKEFRWQFLSYVRTKIA